MALLNTLPRTLGLLKTLSCKVSAGNYVSTNSLFFSLFQPQTMSCYKKNYWLHCYVVAWNLDFPSFFFGLLNHNQIIIWLIIIWVGWIVSSLLAGATVGSFTGGSLADKFGRTRTFQLDAVPLAAGAFLWCVLHQLYYSPCFMKANT